MRDLSYPRQNLPLVGHPSQMVHIAKGEGISKWEFWQTTPLVAPVPLLHCSFQFVTLSRRLPVAFDWQPSAYLPWPWPQRPLAHALRPKGILASTAVANIAENCPRKAPCAAILFALKQDHVHNCQCCKIQMATGKVLSVAHHLLWAMHCRELNGIVREISRAAVVLCTEAVLYLVSCKPGDDCCWLKSRRQSSCLIYVPCTLCSAYALSGLDTLFQVL